LIEGHSSGRRLAGDHGAAVTFLPTRVTFAFTAAATAAFVGGVLSWRVLADEREHAAAVAQAWRVAAVLERARAVVVEADAACGLSGSAERCDAKRDDAERVASELRAAAAHLAPPLDVTYAEKALRVYVASASAARGAQPSAEGGRRGEVQATVAHVQKEHAAAMAALEHDGEGRAPLAGLLVVGTNAALLLLVAIAAASVRGHLRERQLREQERARVLQLQQQLLGIVGHDLRTPLNAIAGSAALLARAPDLPSNRVRLAQRIVSSAGRMSRLLRDLLDFTRVRAEGHLPVSPEPVNLGALCQRVAQEVTAAKPDTIVQCEVEGDVTGEWDPDRIEQVVSNLVTNACNHGAAGRPVEVRVTGFDEAVRIAVHNEGPPIPRDELPHIFEPFWRGDGGGPPGLGLGLHIVRTLVEAHGGTVDVSSGAGGTTFAVVLPAPLAEAALRTGRRRTTTH
jgi:signal transduction histidine kinase